MKLRLILPLLIAPILFAEPPAYLAAPAPPAPKVKPVVEKEPAKDSLGKTAADYIAVSKDFIADGKKDLALLCYQRAQKLGYTGAIPAELLEPDSEAGQPVADIPRFVPTPPHVSRGWILREKVKDSDTYLILNGGHMFKVNAMDKLNCSLWLRSSRINVYKGTNPRWPYVIVNEDERGDDRSVSAKLVGNDE